MSTITTKPAQIYLTVDGGEANTLTAFDLPIQDEGKIHGSSIAYGLAKALHEQMAHIDDDAWKHQIRDWLFPSEKSERAAVADAVNHPSHYTAYKGLEVIDLTEQLNFNRGNAVKYITRAGLKDPSREVEDLEKAVWYTKREIRRITT